MANTKYDYFLVKQKEGRLLKFSYDSNQGIYYKILINDGWSEKINVYKDSFEYFYVFEEWNDRIHVLCQDICGDLILCTLEGAKWKYKTILYMKYGVIMPINIRAFFYYEDIHVIYSITDKNTSLDVLVHQIAKNNMEWTNPQIISKLDYYSDLAFYNYQDGNYNNIGLLDTIFDGRYQLISRRFYITEGRWGKEEIIYTSLSPYIDFAFYGYKNRSHYLFITQDNKINSVIYQYKEIGFKKNTILFEDKKIESCLLIIYNKVLWALWISENKFYGCFSRDYGENFSKPKVYRIFDKTLPLKVFYQEYLEGEKNNYIANEIYTINSNGEEELFLNEILESKVVAEIDKKKITYKYKDYNLLKQELKTYLEKINKLKKENEELILNLNKEKEKLVLNLKKEKEELELTFKNNLELIFRENDEEIMKLNEVINDQKKQITTLKYKYYSEKEKNNMYIEENHRLKDKNSYLQKKLLLNEKEKISVNKKVIEKESLNDKSNSTMIEEIPNLVRSKIKNIDDNSKQPKFSFIKWLFDD